MNVQSSPTPLLLLGLLCAAVVVPAHACRNVKSDDVVAAGRVELPDETQRDVYLHLNSNNRNGLVFDDCPNDRLLDVEISMNAPGLTYVRDVNWGGQQFPAYGWSATSPLIAFQAYKSSAGAAAGTDRTPLRIEQVNRFQVMTGHGTNVHLSFSLSTAVFSRGGQMSDVPAQTISATSRFPGFAGPNTFQHQQTFSLALPQRTCTLADQPLALGNASPSQLLSPGTTVGLKPLLVAMDCPRAGIDVHLTLTDATDPANRSMVLTPTAASTAAAVALQILRNGRAISLGAPWAHGTSVPGVQQITLAARYIRLAGTLKTGTVEGKAILTADYR